MSNPEQSKNNESQDPVRLVALAKAGKINPENFNENDRVVLDYYYSLTFDDPKFNDEVEKYVKKILNEDQTSLKNIVATQPSLFPKEIRPSDPEKKIMKFGADLDKRFFRYAKNPIDDKENEYIKNKKRELRNIIGLPVARGKDAHVKDRFYKFLVRRVYTYDTFGIFNEYSHNFGTNSEELNIKITLVKDLVNELLNTGLNYRERYDHYDDFRKNFEEQYGLYNPFDPRDMVKKTN